ncbi:unnamed protein product [Haemonchus placei]|uniref:DEAD domain-containing protein n=1 Tax=Haemonchus placei TaxID=6290 RepID=A0A0N4WID7_HAEPC|nr:unnamed protein product [Haemonchus placei]
MVQIAVIIPRTSVFELNNWRHGTTILVATIGRMKNFLCEGHISLRKIKFIILDEVETMLELGARISTKLWTLAGLYLKPNFLTITHGQSNIPNYCIAQEVPDFLVRYAKGNRSRVDTWNTDHSRH